MLIDKADFCHLMRGQPFKIAQLIAKSADLMGHQQFRLWVIGKPPLIVENMQGGGRIPAAVDHLFGDRRRQITRKRSDCPACRVHECHYR
ncbi:Uncharacterised protein [Pantoea agglomerans]|uniref:Uncharacterized protein n=1 Tax=Enterobacter agglomerans TaxID=549 RepID=A0A379AKK1_ENTAG|nr:Uncharacterised protein [Pantoea agglomerans]